ncbi:protoporphyrin IX magnesium-chelatase [Micromonospora sp. Llam0]|uniref:VWA domain-containing protein n=1 Tax=Micromonospora sp. Llam0 TaxID=2485143 RepID=UPI000F4784C7|nr:VWA domain-containing protein [Micromonospora sp. Llam0]ROO59852.1 protoporphyrin IX magnesium-chelatase [Micromonospora sp. Llam0]
MTPYPFTAVVGLPDLRQALLLGAVHPGIGGVLIRGEKGTAKSTIVRALAGLLPEVDRVLGCRFGCDPAAPDPACPDGPHTAPVTARGGPAALVELPVGATEDRVVGTLDIQRVLSAGVKAYEPGLLAAAHRGLLYVDEVNLLPDHLVDLLLDAAAMGRAHVERDGVSVSHAARFLLVGTMNPEEGEPRPQLLDRFGLMVSVAAPTEVADRAEVVRRRLAYETDPVAFADRWRSADNQLALRVRDARAALPAVTLPDAEIDRIARICLAYQVDGMRADIVMARAAVALAAWRGKLAVTAAEVADAARLALPHRRRRDPLDPPGADEQRLDEVLRDECGDDDPGPPPPQGPPPPDGGPSQGPPDSDGGPPSEPATPDAGGPADGAEQPDGVPPGGPAPAAAGPAYRPRTLRLPGLGAGATPGRRSAAHADRGRVVGAGSPTGRPSTVHLPATVRAAASRGARRITPADLRQARYVGQEANLILFVVDASGSMAARQRMTVVKTAVLSLLRDAYHRRDRIGMITFRGAAADVVLPPTSSHEVAVAKLAQLRTGGRTPIAAGLRAAATTVAAERRRDPRRRPLVLLVTDGRSTSGPDPTALAPLLAGTAMVVLDCESGPVRLGLARRLATGFDAEWLPLEALSAVVPHPGAVNRATATNRAGAARRVGLAAGRAA